MLLGLSALGHIPVGAGLGDQISSFNLSVVETLNAMAAQSASFISGGGFGSGPLGSFAMGEMPIGGSASAAPGSPTSIVETLHATATQSARMVFNRSVIEALTITTRISYVRIGNPHRSIRFMTPPHRGPRSRR